MKSIKNQKGQALVEFAIILPLLLLLVLGIIQFGMIIGGYLAVQNAVREGARAGVIGCTNAEINSTMRSVSPNLKSEHLIVSIMPSEGSRRSGETLMIRASYNYPLTIPIIESIFGGAVPLRAEIAMRIE